MKKVLSREYQLPLLLTSFPQNERGIFAFFNHLKNLYPGVTFCHDGLERIPFEQFTYDTPERTFFQRSVRLRRRTHKEQVAYTQKVVSADVGTIAHAEVHCQLPKSRCKLEENIYVYHAMWAIQTTTKSKQAVKIEAVKDWCELFPGAAELAPTESPLAPGVSTFFVAYHELGLNFDGEKCDATLEFKYNDSAHTELRGIEFAWKHASKNEAFSLRTSNLMHRFYDALAKSGWVDLQSSLEKKQADGL